MFLLCGMTIFMTKKKTILTFTRGREKGNRLGIERSFLVAEHKYKIDGVPEGFQKLFDKMEAEFKNLKNKSFLY